MRKGVLAGAVAGLALGSGWQFIGHPSPAPVAAAAKPAAEAPEPAGRVGYVHVGRVLCETSRGRAHARELAALRSEHGPRVDALRDEAERLESAARAAPTAEARAPLEEKARGARAAFEAADADARRAFEAKSDRLVGEMYQELAVAAAGLARECGLDAVQTYPAPPGTLDVRQMRALIEAPGALLYVKRDADFTDEVIRRLDGRFAE